MKILRILLYLLLILLGVYLVLCILGPKRFDVSRSVVIRGGSQGVFDEISDFSRWSAWSPWSMRDSAMENAYTGNPGETGHRQEWTSQTQGSGSQTIVEIRPGAFLRTELKFNGWDGASYSNFILEPNAAGDSTRVTWTMEGSDIPFFLRAPVWLMGGQKMIEKDYEEGLANLRKVVESKPSAVYYEVVDIPETWYIGKRRKINMNDSVAAFFESAYSELMAAIGGPGKMAGMPFSIGHEVNMETGEMDLEAAIPIASQMPAPAGLNVASIPAGKCARYIYTGPYEGTGAAWQPFMDELTKLYQPRWAGYEVYVNDPGTVKDKSELITWLMQPI